MNPFLRRRDFIRGATAATAVGHCRHALGISAVLTQNTGSVTFDSRSISINGKRTLLICGEMHYSRSTRQMWPALLDRSKALGINCIASYVFWNVHEPARDVYEFSGAADIRYFLDLCRQRDLHVLLRVGPYCCAEWNFGGFPPYLRDEPGITIRTMNQPYLQRVEKFFTRLAAEVKPALATEGGSVTLVQVENEYANVAKRYGAAGQEYLKWMVGLANRVGFGAVVLTECEGGAPGAIETGNGDTFPPDKIARFRAKAPNAPLFWSESYPGWYELWGGEPHTPRDPRNLAFETLDFLAGGGSGWNYYMWHGGTNFGRTSMYLQTTSYDFHAPLDEYGRPTLMGNYLGRMHHVLEQYSQLLLSGVWSQATLPSGIVQTQWKSAQQMLTLLINHSDTAATAGSVTMAPKSARFFETSRGLVFETESAFAEEMAAFDMKPWVSLSTPFEWTAWPEPMPAQRIAGVTRADDAIEQLSLTKDQTDYCWYSTTIDVSTSSAQKLVIPYGGDFFYLFIDGRLVDQTPAPLHENRGPITPENPAHPRILANRHEAETLGFRHEFLLPPLAHDRHRIDLLCTAMGMIKGDWQIASPMNFERKGIWEGVLLDDVAIKNWEMRPFLVGETRNIPTHPENTVWRRELAQPSQLTWHRTSFGLPVSILALDADFRLDATGLGKGSAFVNGHGLGRYWLTPRSGGNPGPTQRNYHIPRAWLQQHNNLVIFEEQAFTPLKVAIQMRSFTA